VRLFPEFTVLFVGYRHGEPVINYLARGLPAEAPGKRFALTDEVDPTRWRYLGVEARSYDKGQDHSPLYEAVAEWADRVNRGALGNEARAREILSNPARPLSPRDEGFLVWCLEHQYHGRFFVEHAKAAGWFIWLRDKKLLQSLSTQVEWSDLGARLVAWIIERSAVDQEFSAGALVWLGSIKGPLPIFLWQGLIAAIWRSWKGNDGPEGRDRLRQWIATLIHRRPEGARGTMLEFFAGDLDPTEEKDLLILFFDHLSEPRLLVDEPFGLEMFGETTPRARFEIQVLGDAGQTRTLDRLWRDSFESHLGELAEPLLAIGERHLRTATRLGLVAEPRYDLLSLTRAVIPGGEDDEVSRPRDGVDTLIRITRDAFLRILDERREAAAQLALRWTESGVSILKRIGIYGVAQFDHVDANKKLEWLLTYGWLRDVDARKEALELLERAYPGAGRELRERLIEEGERVSRELGADEPEEESRQQRQTHWLWRFLRVLHRADPDCGLVSRAIQEVEERHPELRPRQEPPRVEVSTAETLVDWTPSKILGHFEQLKEAPSDWSDREDRVAEFLREVSAASVDNFDWSIGLAEALRGAEGDESSIWRALIRAWEESNLGVESWSRLMVFLTEHLPDGRFDPDLADLLEKRIKALDEEEAAPEAFIKPAVLVATNLAARSAEEEDRPQHQGQDWLQLAINRTAGKVALFTVAAASKLWKAHGKDWSDQAPELFDLIESLLSPPAGRSRLGRPVLCSQFGFFQFHRSDWTHEKILPLFNWEKDEEAAAQAWNGFIFWGRFSPKVWEALLPYLRQTFKRLETLDRLDRLGSQLARDLARVAFYLADGPLQEGWLQEFLTGAKDDHRLAWAHAALEILQHLDSDQRHQVWDRWLREYVKQRLGGLPPLGEREWEAMAAWALYLERDLPEVVALFRSRSVHLTELYFLWRLGERGEPHGKLDREALFDQPNELGLFLEHLLAGFDGPFAHLRELETCLIEIGKREIDRDLLRRLADRFRELGGTISGDLQALLDGEAPDGTTGTEGARN